MDQDESVRTNDHIVYLFSSNIRPLYEQDILDVIAAPSGTHYRFRYEADYVSSDLKRLWHTAEIIDMQVLVHFSLQQVREYQEAAFIPVRYGRVVEATEIGEFLVLEFSLTTHVSLLTPEQDQGRVKLAGRVTEYTKRLRESVPHPYTAYASLAPNTVGDLLSVEEGGEGIRQFTLTAKFLQGTDSFGAARFLRFLRLQEPGKAEIEPIDGVFTLTGGRTYELVLLHSQPSEVVGRHGFRVSVDQEIIRLIGAGRFDIASRYDVITIPIHANRTDTVEPRETLLVIEPDADVKGPTIRLRFRVTTPGGRVAGAIAVTSVGLVLVGLPGVVTVADPLKVLFLVIGGVVAATSAVLGLRRPS